MAQRVSLFRMKLPEHECPYGLLAKRMLEDAGFEIEEHLLTSREQVDEFKAEQGVDTTPIIFIGDKRIDGSEQLADYLQAAEQA